MYAFNVTLQITTGKCFEVTHAASRILDLFMNCLCMFQKIIFCDCLVVALIAVESNFFMCYPDVPDKSFFVT